MTENSKSDYKKILFRFVSNITEEECVETMWSKVIDEHKGHYQLDSIPFYGPLVNSDDVILAEFDEQEEMLTYRKTIHPSGNSTVQVLLNDGAEIELVRNKLRELGCVSEKMNASFFVLEIPAKLNYKEIKKVLDQKSKEEIFEYAEPSLSAKHWQDLI
jgi:hypothetical protein